MVCFIICPSDVKHLLCWAGTGIFSSNPCRDFGKSKKPFGFILANDRAAYDINKMISMWSLIGQCVLGFLECMCNQVGISKQTIKLILDCGISHF